MSLPLGLRRAVPGPWQLALLLGAVVLVAYFGTTDVVAADLLYDAWGTMGAALMVAGVVIHRPRRRWPWLVMALGLGLMAAGDWAWTILEQVHETDPFPSIADAFYLAGELTLAVGLLEIVRRRVPGHDRAGLLDAIILATGFGVLSWVWFMDPVTSDGGSVVEMGVALAYPIIDVALLGIVARLAMAPGPRTLSERSLQLALVAFLVGDLGFAYLQQQGTYALGNPIDAALLMATAAFAVAALHPSMRELSETGHAGEQSLTSRRMLVLAGASLMAPAVLLVQATLGTEVDVLVIAVGAIALVLLVLARLFLVVSDLRRTLGERQQLEVELKRQALHDPLTGLANRVLFGDRLTHALSRRRELVAVLFLDLDDFKTVNDSLGHDAGDQLLAVAASRLRSAIRPQDTAARLGGDEFAVLLEDSPDLRVAGAVAERLLTVLAEPVEIAGELLSVRASIGISLGVAGTTGAQALMREADIAMYLAKGQGKGRYAVFEPAMHLSVVRGLELRADLEQALARGQFSLDYQPIVRLATGRLVSLEALIRWNHPDRGLLLPLEFIPLSEATGLIIPIGRWVIGEACRATIRLRTVLDEPDLTMNVNLSPVQLADPELVEAVRVALADSGLEPRALVLEMTESVVPDRPAAAAVLRALHGLGVRLAIDDFGSGYSSLGHLSELPFDIVKLDRAFTMALGSGDRSLALAGGIVALGRSLGLDVIAEGIERHEQLQRLRELGCELGQGNLIALPGPEAALAGRPPGLSARREPARHALIATGGTTA